MVQQMQQRPAVQQQMMMQQQQARAVPAMHQQQMKFTPTVRNIPQPGSQYQQPMVQQQVIMNYSLRMSDFSRFLLGAHLRALVF